jgi:hypothetical protein
MNHESYEVCCPDVLISEGASQRKTQLKSALVLQMLKNVMCTPTL